jgi:hypothetical protein
VSVERAEPKSHNLTSTRRERGTGLLMAGGRSDGDAVALCVRLLVSAFILFMAASAAVDDYASARRKLDAIENEQLKPGARVELTMAELKAYAQHELPTGVRDPQIQVTAPEIVTGAAMVDLEKVERSLGRQPGWLMRNLLSGERPLSVTARIRSAGGKATVEVQKVRISGMEIEGATLDFLIDNVLLPLYPAAAVNGPFELGDRIERIDVQPKAVTVIIGR